MKVVKTTGFGCVSVVGILSSTWQQEHNATSFLYQSCTCLTTVHYIQYTKIKAVSWIYIFSSQPTSLFLLRTMLKSFYFQVICQVT